MLKEVLLDAAQDKVNGALFTSEAQKQFVPAFKSFGLPFFKSLDAMQSFNLIEQKEDEKSITRRYQAVYGKKALIWNFRLSKDGKIMSLEPIPE
jgi:hypothetical protein